MLIADPKERTVLVQSRMPRSLVARAKAIAADKGITVSAFTRAAVLLLVRHEEGKLAKGTVERLLLAARRLP